MITLTFNPELESKLKDRLGIQWGKIEEICHFIYHLTFIIYHSFGSRLETSPKLRERLETKIKDVQCSMFNVQCSMFGQKIMR